jgi:hypothetical protein
MPPDFEMLRPLFAAVAALDLLDEPGAPACEGSSCRVVQLIALAAQLAACHRCQADVVGSVMTATLPCVVSSAHTHEQGSLAQVLQPLLHALGCAMLHALGAHPVAPPALQGAVGTYAAVVRELLCEGALHLLACVRCMYRRCDSPHPARACCCACHLSGSRRRPVAVAGPLLCLVRVLQ